MRSKQPTGKPLWHWPARLLVVLVLLTLVGLFLRNQVARQAARQLEEIASRSEPTTFAQILDIYEKDTPAEDGWKLWASAFEKLQTIGEGNDAELQRLPYVGFADENLTSMALARGYLAERSAVLALLHIASDRGGVARFPAEIESGFYGYLPPNGLIDANQLLQLESSVAAQQGDRRRCAAALRARQSLANSLANSPDNASQAVSRSIHGLALDDIAKYFAVGFSDEELAQFQSKARAAQDERALLLMCLTRRAHGISMFEDSASAETHFDAYNRLLSMQQVEIPKQMLGLQFVGPHEQALWLFIKPWDYRLFLDVATRLVEASKLSWPQAIDAAAETESYVEDKLESDLMETAHLLTRMLVKTPSRQFTAVARHVARVRAFDSAVAVELYRRTHGHMPSSLDALVPEFLPEVPTDPFSGLQICYSFESDGFVCYSVGENRIDDNGESTHGNGPDIACRLSTTGERAP